MVAAPNPRAGEGTAEIAAEVARLTGFALVVGAAGEGIGHETLGRRVGEVARGPLALYAEIVGNDRRDAADRIEIATTGVDADQSLKLRTLLELVRDSHLRGQPARMRLSVRIEPASGAGLAGGPARALRIDLPRLARHEARELYALILADFLREAVALPVPARR